MISLFSKEKDQNIASKPNIYGAKVAVAAIAKDEAAYLHEWIHHYLYMGFTKIFIGINRTTDDSKKLLSKIKKKFPHVYFYDVTWLDQGHPAVKNPQMQALSYSFLSNEIVSQHLDITHVMYCDVDEFWYSNGFQLSISELVNNLGDFDVLSFNWQNQTGDTEIFERPFQNLSYDGNRHMKSLHSVSSISSIREFRCHASKYEGKAMHIDASGKEVVYGEHDQVFKTLPTEEVGAYVLHRMLRSEVEYTALLLRERPGVEVPIKNNRTGFTKRTEATTHIELDTLSQYWKSLEKFVSFCDIKDEIDTARKALIEKSNRVLDVEPAVLANHLGAYMNVLSGTPFYYKIIDVLESESLGYLKDDIAKKLFDAGMKLEQEGNKEIACRFLRLAHKARPSGPVIKENLDRLEHLLRN